MEADLAQAETDIQNALASITNTHASVTSAKSNLDVVLSRKEKAQHDFDRDQNLFKDGAITQKQFDDSKAINRSTAPRTFLVQRNPQTVFTV